MMMMMIVILSKRINSVIDDTAMYIYLVIYQRTKGNIFFGEEMMMDY